MSKKLHDEPLRFRVQLLWDGETGAESKTSKGTIQMDMPEEFGGLGRSPCPDEVFLSAIGGCLITTFLFFKRRFNAYIKDLSVNVDGDVAFINGTYRITKVTAKLRISTIESERERAERCGRLAVKYCHITNSIKPAIDVEVTYEINTIA